MKTTAGKAAGITSVDLDDSDDEGSILQYAGVLKKPPPSQKKALTLRATTRAAPTTLRRLGSKFKLPPSDSPTSSSPAVNGAPPAKLSILRRLGKLPATHQGKSMAPSVADTQDNKVTTSTRPRAQERLSIASPSVSSSTGATAGGDSVGAQMDMRAISVFKRLGNKKT